MGTYAALITIQGREYSVSFENWSKRSGSSMSCVPRKIEITGISKIFGTKVFYLRFLQSRNPEWACRPFYAKYDPKAIWTETSNHRSNIRNKLPIRCFSKIWSAFNRYFPSIGEIVGQLFHFQRRITSLCNKSFITFIIID